MDFYAWQRHEAALRSLLQTEASEATEGEDSEERMHNDLVRTMEFLWVFGLFCAAYCSLSFYIYFKPHDSAHGFSLVSRIRRMPVLGWFYRQRRVTHAPVGTSDEMERLEEDRDDIDEIELGERKDGDKDTVPPSTRVAVSPSTKTQSTKPKILIRNSEMLTLLVCALFLICSYLIWGLMQERIMGHPYGDAENEDSWFHSSQWCVLLNRVSGLTLSTIALKFFVAPSGNDCPPYYFAMCSMSNMMSSWFQYESLHYVTFPVQTVFKSSKVFVTMLVGRVMGKQFPASKYLNAILIGVGVSIFLFGQRQADKVEGGDGPEGWYFVLGLALITCYAFCDAFTSNWQSKTYEVTQVSSWEMMQGVNAFTFLVSLIFTLPDIGYIMQFYATHPLIWAHSALMSAAAGFGQMLIFFTIQQFGAMKFSVVMTTRMVLSVIISIIYYQHPVTGMGIFGMGVTFAALFYQIYAKQRK